MGRRGIVMLWLLLAGCGRIHYAELDAGALGGMDAAAPRDGAPPPARDAAADAARADARIPIDAAAADARVAPEDAGGEDARVAPEDGGVGSEDARVVPADASGADAGSCECEPGVTEEVVQACGLGEGSRTWRRTCTAACTWGFLEPISGCSGAVCTPGTFETCGVGGFRRCSAGGTWCQCNPESDSGSAGGWVGCRGNGLNVCEELVADAPCYWENHPRCVMNDDCGALYAPCHADCPEPSAEDRCMCAPSAGGWLGCADDACGVCDDILFRFPCYTLHHWACKATTCGGAAGACDEARCPPPTEADIGTLE